ncbi:baseplate J/gp47 family protein [Clostridium sp. AWRP]|nr:baseplate J/gp47 family protein [Clostridium sp. AWRP]
MLNDIPSDIDKSEGSFVYDAVSPASNEAAQIYITDDEILKRTSPFTAAGTDLENITNPVGIKRKQGDKAATKLRATGVDGTVILAGTFVQTKHGLTYVVQNDTVLNNGQALVDIQARDVGSKYNVPANTITQMTIMIQGIMSITNPDPVINGYNIEDDDSLRKRYFERMQTPAASGNKAQYKSWAKEVTGVGDAKVFPLWNGNGTVKIVIVNENKRAADQQLIQKVKNYIDPEPSSQGEGQAPIGAALTVVSASERAINLSAKVILAEGYVIQQVQDNFAAAIEQYLSDLAFKDTYVSYAKIGRVLLEVDGVVDYSNLILNDNTVNAALDNEEIPVMGTIDLGV